MNDTNEAGVLRLPRRVLVTGAGGFVGSSVCDALLARGDDVIGLEGYIDSYARHLKVDNLRNALAHPRFRLVEADLSRDPLDHLLEGVDVVVNEAAIAGLPRSWSDIESYARHNVVALQRLLEASRRAGVGKFVHASTSSVYGRDATCDEDGPTRPVSPYGATKLAGEHLLFAYHEDFGLPVTALRYFSIYGPRQRPDMAYMIFIDRLLQGQSLTVFGDGLQTRSNTYIGDCVEATLLAIDRGRAGAVYNIGGGDIISLNEAIDIIADVLEVRPQIMRGPARSGDQRHTAADIGRARSELGFSPRVSPEEGLAAQAAWRRERRGLPMVVA